MKMKSFQFLMILLVIHGMRVICEKGFPALIFKQKVGSFVTVDSSDPETKCKFCAAACPVLPDKRNKTNFDDLTITRNSLDVQDVFEDPVGFDDIDLNICERPYTPSIIFDSASMTFELGYEVYYDNEKFGKFFRPTKYQDYRSVTDGITLMKAKSTKKLLQSKFYELMIRSMSSVLNQDFIWISVLTLEFNVILMNPTHVDYKNKLNIEQKVVEKCENYDLGKELYNGIDLNQIYEEETQKNMFRCKKLPRSSHLKNTHLLRCGNEYGCFVKTPLVPDYYFNSSSSVRASCSNAITVPVWETIANDSLRRVDEYLFTVSRLWKSNIHIYSGTYEILRLASRRRYFLVPQWQFNTFLDISNKKIPVPRILYKIIRLEMNFDTYYVEQYAMIVIHNDPIFSFKKLERFCPKNDELSGWDAITSLEADSDRVYVCPVDQNTFKKLKLNLTPVGMSNLSPLALDKFPLDYTAEEGLRVFDQRDNIDIEWKKIFPEVPEPETNSSA